MQKITTGHRVSVLRDITRIEGTERVRLTYAVAGETGEVIETFGEHDTKRPTWHAKVKMDAGGIKTFRITSLKRVSFDPPSGLTLSRVES